MTPRARRIAATRVELRATDGADIPVQADGDLVGARPAWSFELRPRAVRLIGRWD
jgi:diacylglycerol kinase family enzyme